MDLLWQINPWEMLSGLMVTTFLMLLNASIVVVASMVMFPLIDLAFKKKAKHLRMCRSLISVAERRESLCQGCL